MSDVAAGRLNAIIKMKGDRLAKKLRREFDQELGYTREAIEKTLKRVAYECQVLNRNGVVAIVAAISPYKALRDAVREQSDAFIEVYCDATPEQLQDRDPEGFFAKARRNEILNVAGVNAPFPRLSGPQDHTARFLH